jgi:hypothetical protein
MIVPGNQFHATNGLIATVAADPTPAGFVGGLGVDANGNLCIATNAVDAGDSYVNGFRLSPKGAVRGSVTGSSGSNFLNGYWFTDNGRLRISDGISAVASWANGDPFVASGRLALSY